MNKLLPAVAQRKLTQYHIVNVLLGNAQVPLHGQLSGTGIAAFKIADCQPLIAQSLDVAIIVGHLYVKPNHFSQFCWACRWILLAGIPNAQMIV